MSFDQVAEHYDETRGGEARGDAYAAEIDGLLPRGDRAVLEIGVGTGVVAIGLRRRGRAVVGIDVSAPMLARARARLGSCLIRCDGAALAIATASMDHAVSVWVLQSVADPVAVLAEVARALRPGGRCVVSNAQIADPTDEIGQVIEKMGREVHRRRGASRPHKISADQVLGWGAQAGFDPGEVHRRRHTWTSSPAAELRAIEYRTWPALRALDEAAFAEVTAPVMRRLRALPPDDVVRRGVAETVVLLRP